MEIESKFGEEKKVLDQLDCMLKESGCSDADGMDIKTAVAEACLNAIEHGNRFSPELRVMVRIRRIENTIQVKVLDHGKGAELKAIVQKGPQDTGNFRGWGLKMINELMDNWSYSYIADKDLFCVEIIKTFNKG